jgi:Fe-S-cluster containining protein
MSLLQIPGQEQLEETIRRFKEEELSPYCQSSCQTSCCDLGDIYLDVSKHQLEMMLVVSIESSFMYGLKAKLELNLDAHVKNAVERAKQNMILKGNLRPHSSNRSRHENDWRYSIEHGRCPAYDKHTKRCRIHSEPRRPEACEEFPMSFDRYHGLYLDERCEYVRVNRHGIIHNFLDQHGDTLLSLDRPITVNHKDGNRIILPS